MSLLLALSTQTPAQGGDPGPLPSIGLLLAGGGVTTYISAGGLHSIWEGIGDPGVGVICQTMHTIEQGIAA